MSIKLSEYRLGDMLACYVTDEQKQQVGLVLLPVGLPYPDQINKKMSIDSLVQLKLVGDIYDAAYANGISMRNGETVRRLCYESQESDWSKDQFTITTTMKDDRGYQVRHFLTWQKGMPYVRIKCSFINLSETQVRLEMFESFSLSELSPYLEADGANQIEICRLRSVWSQEGRMESIPLEDLQLEPAWDPHAVRCEKFGQAGSLPVNRFFPFAAVKDKQNQVIWGVQIAHPASWQIEFYRKDDGLAMSGGLADRDFGHWLKEVGCGEEFVTPEAIVSVCRTDSMDIFTNRLTMAGWEAAEQSPAIEQELPIIFNEYCTTWGCPSHQNITEILKAIRGRGFTYFVIDCGWYKEEGVPWDISMGDYQVSDELFPQGLQETVSAIKAEGLIPGIWFEIENVGSAANAYHNTEHLLKKDGEVITTYFRRFWDMRDPWVQNYLSERVIGTLKRYGFGYLKVDYNETIGIGCDGAESLGEGLRQNMQASTDFFKRIKTEIPGMVLENCASGGHRLEPSLMGISSMASFSDAHECVEIPIIAADLHRCILPRQSQIWAVIRQDDSLQRIAYSIANTFLGRMCISGDVTQLSKDQWRVIEDGMQFYRKIAPVIKTGQSYRFGTKIGSIRHPEGWQAVIRVGENKAAYAVIHIFAGVLPECIRIPLPKDCADNIAGLYSYTDETVHVQDGIMEYQPENNFTAIGIYLCDTD